MIDAVIAAYVGSTETILLGMFGLPQHDSHVKRVSLVHVFGMLRGG